MRAALFQIEVEAKFFGHHLEIVNLHLRRELLPGMRTDSLRPLSTCLAIDGYAELRRPLDNMKELPKGIQIRKRITVIAWVTAMNG